MVVNALNIALLSISIIEKDWFLFAIVFFLLACCTMLISELKKAKEEKDLTI